MTMVLCNKLEKPKGYSSVKLCQRIQRTRYFKFECHLFKGYVLWYKHIVALYIWSLQLRCSGSVTYISEQLVGLKFGKPSVEHDLLIMSPLHHGVC